MAEGPGHSGRGGTRLRGEVATGAGREGGRARRPRTEAARSGGPPGAAPEEMRGGERFGMAESPGGGEAGRCGPEDECRQRYSRSARGS